MTAAVADLDTLLGDLEKTCQAQKSGIDEVSKNQQNANENVTQKTNP